MTEAINETARIAYEHTVGRTIVDLEPFARQFNREFPKLYWYMTRDGYSLVVRERGDDDDD